jgi:large subunit ribosomal protein L3
MNLAHQQDPGKVWKGRKMAGRMGGKFRTTQNLLVHRVDLALNLIYVRGHVPGVDDQYIEVSDAVRKVKWKAEDSFMSGKDSDDWLDEGVTGLPMPGLTLEDVKSGEWPEVVEWPGTGKPLTS